MTEAERLRVSSQEYRAASPETRAMFRCFVRLDALPLEALQDMRSLSIAGSSLARQIVDEGSASESAVASSKRMIETYENGTGRLDP